MIATRVISLDLDDTLWPVGPVIASAETVLLDWLKARYPRAVRGHTIESISILVFDLQKNAGKPYAVLTGDTLFIGDVGRPDLRASLGWTAQELSGHLYDSLHGKLLQLPENP